MRRKSVFLFGAGALVVVFLSGGAVMALEFESAVFKEGERIPVKYTCEGDDVSPPLAWKNAPPGTKSFTLICDDPDAPGKTWVHWVVYNIPAAASALPEAVASGESLSDGTRQGSTDFQSPRYGGPCPPPGRPHRYFFKIYALDTVLNFSGKVTKKTVMDALEGHILDKAVLMGTYERRKE